VITRTDQLRKKKLLNQGLCYVVFGYKCLSRR